MKDNSSLERSLPCCADRQVKRPHRFWRGALAATAGFVFSLQAWAGLTASVTVSGSTNIYPGQTTNLVITLANSNASSDINNLSFSNSLPGTLPNGLKMAGTPTYICTDPATNTTAAGVGTLTANLGAQSISLTGGVIPKKDSVSNNEGSCVITLPVTAGSTTGTGATYTYLIASGAVTGNDGAAVANAGNVSQSINTRSVAVPTISKAFGASTLYVGGNATTLTITITNSNPITLPGFNITDNLPGSGAIQVAPTPNASAVCTGGVAPSFNPVAGATSISATGGTVAANGTCVLKVDVVAANSGGAYSTSALTNTINGATDFSNDLGLVPANATANVTAKSPLRVSKAFLHSAISAGQNDTFTITLANDGPSALNVVSFADDPIDSTTAGAGHPVYGLLVSGSVTTTCAGGSVAATSNNTGVRLTGGTIPAGGSCGITVTFSGQPQTSGAIQSFTNTIPAGAVDVGNPAIISQPATASVAIADAFQVTKSVAPQNVMPGNPVQYKVRVSNYAATAFSNVAVTDPLPDGQTFLTGVINGIDYTPSISAGCGTLVSPALGATSPVLTIPTLPARVSPTSPNSCLLTFWAMVPKNASLGSHPTNAIPVDNVCDASSPTPTCNKTASNSVNNTVGGTSLLSATKAFSPNNTGEGTVSRMTITLSSTSANPLTNVSLTDNLVTNMNLAGVVLNNPPNVATTCGSPAISATAGGTVISMTGATVPARGNNGTADSASSCTLSVDVVGPAGAYTNTIPSGQISATETYADGTTHAINSSNSPAGNLTYTSVLCSPGAPCTKTFSPASVSSGGKSTVTLRLRNSGSVALTNVSATDPLPTGMVLATPPNAYATCDGSPSITANAGASSINLTGATIAGLGSCDLLFDVVATGSANWTNTIPAGNITAANGIKNVSPVAGTLNYNASANIQVAKQTFPTSTLTAPGQVVQLIVTVTAGSQAVTNLSVTDYFTNDGTAGGALNGMVVAATPAASTTCTGGTVSTSAGATSVSLSGATLAVNASCTFSVNVTSTTVGGITNTIPAGAVQTSQGASNSAAATTSLATQTNIGVAKQFLPDVVKPGNRSRLRITFYNPRNLTLDNISTIDTLPAGVTVPSSPGASSTCTGATVSAPDSGHVQISGATLGPAPINGVTSCDTEIDVLVSSQGDYLNTIPAGTVTATVNGTSVNNSQPATATLRARMPLTVAKSFANATRLPGQATTMTITVTNPNNAGLTAMAFTDSLPSGLVVAQTPNAATTCTSGTVVATASGTTVGLTGASLPANSSCNVTVDVLSNIAGTYTNTIPANAVTTFEGVKNENPASATVIVAKPPTVTKQFSPSVIAPNGFSTLNIVISNDNAATMTLTANMDDVLPTAPGQMKVATFPNLTTTCGGTAPVAAVNALTVRLPTNATIPAGGCSISVDVTATASGTYNNNIPANALQTNLGNNPQPANASLNISTLGYVSGRVFKDNNLVPDGVFNGADVGLSGVSIELRSGSDCTGALVSASNLTNPTTTDGMGNYAFAGLSAGTYTVCEPTQPSGTVNGKTTAGSITVGSGGGGTPGTASNPTASSSLISGIVLNANGAAVSGSSGNNFAEIATSSITGTVFIDSSNDGVRQAGETPISGVPIQLSGYSYGANGVDDGGAGDDVPVTANTTTNASGLYSFTGLAPGVYQIDEPGQPTNTANGKVNASLPVPTSGVGVAGVAGTQTNPTTTSSRIAGLKLPPGTVASGNDFPEIATGRSITGKVYLDTNNNGVVDGADSGIASQTINLTGTDASGNPVSLTTTTLADGSYSFTGLANGTYTITQPSQPASTANGLTTCQTSGCAVTTQAQTPSVISNVVLSDSVTASANNNFGEVQPPTVGKSFTPTTISLGATSNLKITLTNAGSGIATLIADFVDNLPQTPGSMVVAAVPNIGGTCDQAKISASGTTVKYLTGGKIPASGSCTITVDVTSTTSGSYTNTISAGALSTDYGVNSNTPSDQLTINGNASVAGVVYEDLNGNGSFDDPGSGGADAAISGVTVKLTGTDVDGNAVSLTTTTAANGSYSFTGVRPSNATGYTITEVQPSGYADRTTSIKVGNPGTAAATKPVAAGGNDTITGVKLNAGDNLTSYNFGEVISNSRVAGVVYEDKNGNGSFDDPGSGGADAVIVGVTVKLTGTDVDGTAVSLQTTTDAGGAYAFTGLRPSNATGYTITEVQPTGYADRSTTIKTGNPGTASATKPVAVGGDDTISGVKVNAGDNLVSYNFGEVIANGRVAGVVYEDKNGNGSFDDPGSGGADAVISGVTVKLTGTDVDGTAVSLQTTTDAGGAYAFTGLRPSNATGYTITEVQPTGYADRTTSIKTGNPGTASATKPVAVGGNDTISGVKVVAGDNLTSYNFGEAISNGRIAGVVYEDKNGNGSFDDPGSGGADAGIAGVTVKLTGTDVDGNPVSLQTTTDANGVYAFAGLRPSNASGYTITEVQPVAFADRTTSIKSGNPGTAMSGKPVATGNDDVITGVRLNSGDNLTGYFYGEANPTPTLAGPVVAGYVWMDNKHTRVRPTDGSQVGQSGWAVQLMQNGNLVCSVLTDSAGFYQFDNLHCPSYPASLPTGSGFSISFSKDNSKLPAVPTSALSGVNLVPSTIQGFTVASTDRIMEQNLPLDPSGVVYDSQSRKPVAGAQVTISYSGAGVFDPSTQLVGGVAAVTQTTGTDGMYQFLLQNAYPTGVYTLTIVSPAGYLPGVSTQLPACNGPVVVGAVPNPAMVQSSDTAPGASVTAQTNPATCIGLISGGAGTTQYYLQFQITNGTSAPLVNNHIPLDPVPPNAILVTKTTPLVNVSRGDLVPYTVTATNTLSQALPALDVVDLMPPGFKYRIGSATLNGKALEPAVTARTLTWTGQSFAAKEKKVFKLLLMVGTGVGDGEYTNQAWVQEHLSAVVSNIATATVRIVPDPTFDCPDVIGKVFDDQNANGYQDQGEPGIPGVRLATVRGLLVTTDAQGRFHVPCPEIPNLDRGSNFVMKLDDRSLPSGYRLTTENPRDVRLTRGKVVKLNFGATIHRVFRLEVGDAAFVPGSEQLLPEWQAKIEALPQQLQDKPSVVRLAYVPGTDAAELAQKRVKALADDIRKRWHELKDMYTLVVETEGEGAK